MIFILTSILLNNSFSLEQVLFRALKLYWCATSSRKVPFLVSALLHHFSCLFFCADKMTKQCTGETWSLVRNGRMPVVLFKTEGNITITLSIQMATLMDFYVKIKHILFVVCN